MRGIKFRAWNGDYFEHSSFNFKTGCLGCNFSSYVEIDTPDQFTGLKDINGVDIYENDLLHCLDPVSYDPIQVEVSSKTAAFAVNLSRHSEVILSKKFISDNELVVIGNIYENQELLENKND